MSKKSVLDTVEVQLSPVAFHMAEELAAETEGTPTVESYIELLIRNDYEAFYHAAEFSDLEIVKRRVARKGGRR